MPVPGSGAARHIVCSQLLPCRETHQNCAIPISDRFRGMDPQAAWILVRRPNSVISAPRKGAVDLAGTVHAGLMFSASCLIYRFIPVSATAG